MGGDKKLRLAWRIAVSFALVACAFYVGCASPEAPSGAAAQQAEVTAAGGEGQADGAPSVDQLYARANQNYANGQYQNAYNVYQQLLSRQNELNEEQTEKVKERVQELHDVMQNKQRHARRKKAAESILEQANSFLEKGNPESAHQHLQMLKENELVQYLDWQQKRRMAKLQQNVDEAMAGVARTKLQELKALVKQEEWDESRAKLAEIDDMAGYLSDEQKGQLANSRVQIFQATGEAAVIPESQREKLAEDWFEQGMDAYDNYNYVVAERFLNWVDQLEVDLGWWDK